MTNAGAVGAAVIAVALVGGALATPAQARDGDRREIRLEGNCSAQSDWRMSAKAREGVVEVEFEVRSVRGRRPPWRVTISRNGAPVVGGVRRARGGSGEFGVRRATAWLPGATAITGYAQNLRSGEVCLATVRI